MAGMEQTGREVSIDEILRMQQIHDGGMRQIWAGQTAKDGIVSPADYLAASVRILWVLKERNEKGACAGTEQCDNRDYWEYCARYNPTYWRKTAQAMALVSWAILNGADFAGTQHLPEVTSDPEGVVQVAGEDVLRKIAVINVKKSVGGSRSRQGEIYGNYRNEQKREFLQRQIASICPDIVINASGVTDLSEDLAQARLSAFIKTGRGCKWKKAGRLLIVHAYHPQQYRISLADYCEGLSCAVRDARHSDV